MRVVKLGLISLIGLFLVIFLLSLLIPSKMRVSRAITIDVPVDSVYTYVNDMRQWALWNALLKNENLHSVQIDQSSFSSDEMKIIMLPPDSTGILTSWERVGQDKIQSGVGITQAANSTIVQWYFDFKVKWYPWEKFGSIVFDKELGPPMEQSLEQLKKVCEKTN
jgi:hypothetical protein